MTSTLSVFLAFSRRVVAVWLLLMVGGCVFSPWRRVGGVPSTIRPLEEGGRAAATRISDGADEASGDGRFVGVALAGGGSRAAVFGGEVLLRLDEMGVMKRVDFVSGISSGAMVGAYYCVSRDAADAGAGDLLWGQGEVDGLMGQGVWPEYVRSYFLNPWKAARYYGTGWNRSYEMGRVLDRKFFRGKTVADLNPKRPRLLVTSTVLETGAMFTFTDRSLAARGVDAGRLALADLVQASSCFPGVFHPYALPDLRRVEAGGRGDFVHLVDGGVYDNLGVAPLLRLYRENRSRFPRGGVIVVVDASLPVGVKEGLGRRADVRGAGDYVIDFGGIVRSLEIMFEVDRLGLMRALREDARELGLRVIHLHYTTGLLSEERDLHDELPNVLHLDDPVATNVDFGAKRELVAPTALKISAAHASATRQAARRVVELNRRSLRAVAKGGR